MATKTIADIHNDLKLLITAISGFEEGEDGFQICERYSLSQIKHHRYLSVNSHAVKREIDEITQKFLILGKYDVAKEFQELVNTFLTSFDFERHPQYDIQWSLLSLILNLSNETNKSEVSTSSQLGKDRSQNVTLSIDEDKSEEIDWGQYLKEGEEDFFCDYQSETDSDWSDDENDGSNKISAQTKPKTFQKDSLPLIEDATKVAVQEKAKRLPQEIISKNWLKKSVQNTWWNELDWNQYKVDSQFEAAHLYEIWRKNVLKSNKIIGTLSEYQVCRELLWMFYAQSSMALFQEESNHQFSIRDVSIPSLTTVAFKSMLSSYCQYFTMMQEMDTFIEKIFKTNSSCNQKPPLTYEAYATALQQELLSIKTGLVEFEKELMKQDGQKTFLSISKTLKKYLDRIKIIFEIHKSVVEDWTISPNCMSASKLLSKIFFKIHNSSSDITINLCASLYLTCLSVYLNIVDIWLSEGRLEDWREEFIIAKSNESLESVSEEDSRHLEGFLPRELDPICMSDPMMKLFFNKVYQLGRSVELLAKLDRITDFWDLMDKDNVMRRKLNEECLQEIILESSKYDHSAITDVPDSVPLEIIEIPVPNFHDADVELNVMQQVSSTNNPFLTKAFETFVLTDTSTDSVDAKSTTSSQCTEDRRFYDFFTRTEMVLPWRKIFERSVSSVLELKFSGASKLVKDILVREYKLEVQLKLMRSVYMMETNHVMNKFCKLIFSEIESNGMWNNAYYVTCLLEEVLSQEWPDSSSRWSVTVTNIRTTNVLEAVNGIKLHYAAGWPINMLLNEEALDKYNQIFRFELKLKWALWALYNLRFADLEGKDESGNRDVVQNFHIKRLESLRFWLLHAIGSIQAYLSGQVLWSLGDALDKALAQSDNLEAIITIHNEYLDNVQEHCLQNEKFNDLTSSIHKLLEMCEELRDKWKPETLAFIGKSLDQLENDYVKHHTHLALGLHNAVQYKDADYHALVLPYVPALRSAVHTMKDRITRFGRCIFNEIAYQTLPPSATKLKSPRKVAWSSRDLRYDSRTLNSANEYERSFVYLHRYRRKDLLSAFDSPSMPMINLGVVVDSPMAQDCDSNDDDDDDDYDDDSSNF